MKTALAFMLLALLLADSQADTIKVFDLGEAGKTTPVDVEALSKQNEAYIASQTRPDYAKLRQELEKVEPADISFQTRIAKHQGEPKVRVKTLEQEVLLPAGTKMLFFTSTDKIPPGILKKVTYGYCLGFNSLKDIEDFREGNKIDFPIQPLLSDNICEWLGITSLPALITINGAQIEIQEGF